METEKSQLLVHELEADYRALVRRCVKSVDAVLDERPEITMWGKKMRQPRSVGFFSDEVAHYNYSTTSTPSKPMTAQLHELLAYVNLRFGSQFNGVLINRYAGGAQNIGKHSDDERGLDASAGVIAISCGTVRKFRVRSKTTGKIEVDVLTEASKIIQMKGDFQKEFTHEVPVEKTAGEGVRYSLTFRSHVPDATKKRAREDA